MVGSHKVKLRHVVSPIRQVTTTTHMCATRNLSVRSANPTSALCHLPAAREAYTPTCFTHNYVGGLMACHVRLKGGVQAVSQRRALKRGHVECVWKEVFVLVSLCYLEATTPSSATSNAHRTRWGNPPTTARLVEGRDISTHAAMRFTWRATAAAAGGEPPRAQASPELLVRTTTQTAAAARSRPSSELRDPRGGHRTPACARRRPRHRLRRRRRRKVRRRGGRSMGEGEGRTVARSRRVGSG